MLRRSFLRGSGEPVPAIAPSSWEAPEVGANLETEAGGLCNVEVVLSRRGVEPGGYLGIPQEGSGSGSVVEFVF